MAKNAREADDSGARRAAWEASLGEESWECAGMTAVVVGSATE